MTIKFRIIQNKAGFSVQTKKWWGWKYKTEIKDISMYEYPSFYYTEEDCVKRVYHDSNYKKERLILIRYPNLVELSY